MQAIIRQIAARFIERVIEHRSEKGIGDIVQTVKGLSEITIAATMQIAQAAIEQAGAALIAANQARREDGLCIKERNVPS